MNAIYCRLASLVINSFNLFVSPDKEKGPFRVEVCFFISRHAFSSWILLGISANLCLEANSFFIFHKKSTSYIHEWIIWWSISWWNWDILWEIFCFIIINLFNILIFINSRNYNIRISIKIYNLIFETRLYNFSKSLLRKCFSYIGKQRQHSTNKTNNCFTYLISIKWIILCNKSMNFF